MSARNSKTSKAAARERLREERERQARKDKVRRQFVVAGSAVVVLAIVEAAWASPSSSRTSPPTGRR